MLIYIHGISGVGKSFYGSLLNKYLSNSIHIDQDTYYKQTKPLVTFSNNDIIYTASNWDTVESIDFEKFNLAIIDGLNNYDYVIVTGFALRSEYMLLKPTYGFLLHHNMNDAKTQSQIIKARLQSKQYKGDKIEKDKWMVIKIVYPYYKETLTLIDYDYKIPVYYNNKRVNKNLILDQLLQLIEY